MTIESDTSASFTDRITISYHGEDKTATTIIGTEFAKSVTGLVAMVQRAQQVIAVDHPKIELRFRAPRQGSFELLSFLQFAEQIPFTDLTPLIIPTPIFVKESVIGFLCEKLKGRSRRTVSESDSDTNQERSTGSLVNINLAIGGSIENTINQKGYNDEQSDLLRESVRKLEEDEPIQRHARNFVSPLNGSTARIDVESNGEKMCHLEPEDTELFEPVSVEEPKEPIICDPMSVRVVQVNFVSGKRWRIRWISPEIFPENTVVTAEIVDQNFLATFDHHTRIGRLDTMYCRIEMIGPVDGSPSDYNVWVKRVYKLLNQDGDLIYPLVQPNQMMFSIKID